MARGFESKDVEFQQSEAERTRTLRPLLTPEARDAQARRDTIALALTRVRADLLGATAPGHRRMLEQAIADLERRLRDGDVA